VPGQGEESNDLEISVRDTRAIHVHQTLCYSQQLTQRPRDAGSEGYDNGNALAIAISWLFLGYFLRQLLASTLPNVGGQLTDGWVDGLMDR